MNTKYLREGRGTCKVCARELDVVLPIPRDVRGLVIARHLRRIEEYGPRGARPAGFCAGSLLEADPVTTPERAPAPKGKRR